MHLHGPDVEGAGKEILNILTRMKELAVQSKLRDI